MTNNALLMEGDCHCGQVNQNCSGQRCRDRPFRRPSVDERVREILGENVAWAFQPISCQCGSDHRQDGRCHDDY